MRTLLIIVGLVGLQAGTCLAQAIGPEVGTMIVRFRDDVAPRDFAVLPAAVKAALHGAIGSSFFVTSRTRDGAFELVLESPMPFAEARAAINRVRLDPVVLYAKVAPELSAPATTGLPTDRLIVKYRDAARVSMAQAGILMPAAETDRIAALASQPVAWLRGTHDGANVLQMKQRLPIAAVEAIAARIASDPAVDYAQPDYIRTAQLMPSDPCYASPGSTECAGAYQWDLFDAVAGINVPPAWDITTGSAGINIAVIDTGALLSHPDLAGRFIGGYDMISDCAVANDGQPGPCTWSGGAPDFNGRDTDAADPGDWVSAAENNGNGTAPPYFWFLGCGKSDSSWHGTHVSGTIGAVPNNGIGIAGINWVSKIVPVRVLGKCGGYTSDVADGIVWAAGGSVPGLPANANPARVLSISLGGSGSCDAATQSAITTANSLGAVVVVAAGNNNGPASNFSPASCDGVITVAATTRTGERARYSNYGSAVEIAAPGGNADGSDPDILSTLNSGVTSPAAHIYARYGGTSMATPHVSGVASLMLSVNPALTPAQVLSKIQTTARAFPTPGPDCNPTPQPSACNCTTSLCGAGIIDAAAAVASAQNVRTSLASSPNPSTSGATVTFTATVTGNAPTGTVNFTDGGVTFGGCGTVALTGSGNSRTAQCATSALAVGSHSIVATYGGDPNNSSSTSNAVLQVVNSSGPGPTTTTLASSLNPSTSGANVTFTATVNGSAPTGTVNFKDNGASIAGCAASVLAGSGNVRTATCATASLAVGAHPIVATYSGNPGNTSSSSATVSQVVNGSAPGPTTTAIVSSFNPSSTGAPVTFTATVTGNAPTGTVTFSDGGQALTGCIAAPLSGSGNSRTATCVTSALAYGSHFIKARYGGDVANAVSTSALLVQSVTTSFKPPTTTVLASSLNPSTSGALVTFTATVTGTAPTGTVDFKDGGVSIAGCNAVALTGAGNSRTAGCPTSGLSAGTHGIVAAYSGDGGNAGSISAPVSQVVNGGAPGTTTTALASSQNPSTAGALVTFTATVTGTAPTGTVNFTEGATSLAGCSAVAVTGSGNSRTAACPTSALTAGTHSIVASYSGDAGNAASASAPLTQTVASGGARSNVALASAGATATASSTMSAAFPASAVNNGDRAGLNYGAGGVWSDATIFLLPDWVEIAFNGSKTLDQVIVYSMQDNYFLPVDPSDTMAFSSYGVTSFVVEGWTGAAWTPLASVTGNQLVKRSVSFAPFATDRIRVTVNAVQSWQTYLTEVEAWGN